MRRLAGGGRGQQRAAARPGTYAASVSHGEAAAPGRPGQPAAAVTELEPAVDVSRLRVAIARLSRRLRRHELAGLTPTQLSALSSVDRLGPIRLGDLAAAEGIAPSTLTRLVTALEEQGFVKRFPVPEDARASTMAMTPRGRVLLDRIREESNTLLADRLRMLTGDELGALTAALPALERLAEGDQPGR